MANNYVEEIIFVDDSDDEAFVTELLLRKEKININIKHFTDYQRVIEHIDNSASNVPILAAFDLNMPVQKGTELISQLYQEYDSSKIIAGIFSGSEDPKDRKDAFEAGAKFFIQKPMDTQFFITLMATLPQFELESDPSGWSKLLIKC